MGIIEGFLNTQQQLGQIQNQDLVNQSILAKLEEQKRAIADQQAVRATLARLNSETPPQAPTLAGMSEVPDAAAEMRGERKMEASPSAPTASAESVLKTNLATADAYEKKAKAIEALDPATAATFRKEADGYRTKAATLLSEQRKEQTEKLKTIANKLTAVTDQATLDAAFSGADPNALTQLFGQNLPRGLDGRVLATPDVIKLANNVGLQSMDAAKRMEIEQKAEEIKIRKLEADRKKEADEETARHNRAVEGNAREGLRLRREALSKDVTIDDEGTVTPVPGGKEETKRANTIRLEQNKKLKPLDDVQEKITKAKALLAESTPASDVQLQTALTDVFDKTRATNLLFKSNQNFGSVAGRISGFVGRAFTGQYTSEQRRQIGEMLNAVESGVIQPSRKSITDYYSKQAERSGVRKELVEAPDFYGSKSSSAVAPATNAAAEADAFLKGLGKAL